MVEQYKGINYDKHIWEDWTVRNFIEALQPSLDMIYNHKSWQKPFKTKNELKKWCIENQPYYKKYIPEVVKYFSIKYNLK